MQVFWKHRSLLLVVFLLALNVFIWQSAFAGEKLLKVAFLNVGQGDAIFIEAPSGKQMLIDGGAGSEVLARLGEIMPQGDRSLDVVIGTHPDRDHVGGLIDVLRSYQVDIFLEPGAVSDTLTFKELKRTLAERGVEVGLARRGMSIVLDEREPRTVFEILFPDRDVSGVKNTNDASVAGKLFRGETSVMLTGDAPQKVEEYMVSLDGKRLASDILKAGHHGSRTSSAERFVRTVAPRYAVISAGKNNSYGHPHREVLDKLSLAGAEILRTDEEGTIVFVSDGAQFIRKR